MKNGQNTRGYDRYLACDIHREYILVGGQNEDQEWVLTPRRVSIAKFSEWAQKNLREGDIVILETTTNVWETYDIIAPLVSRVLVANASGVGEIVGARVKTDKEDIKRLLRVLIGGIVPEVWVPPTHVRELRAFISYRNRLVATGAMIRNRLQSLLHKHNLMLPEEGILDQGWWDAQRSISALEKIQIRQELALLEEIEKYKAAVEEELGRQFTSKRWGSQAVRLVQLPGVGVVKIWWGMQGWEPGCMTVARHTRRRRSPKREERNYAGRWWRQPGGQWGCHPFGKRNMKNICGGCAKRTRPSWSSRASCWSRSGMCLARKRRMSTPVKKTWLTRCCCSHGA
jgi:hypothetical protein